MTIAARILVVEDEAIIALDLRQRLEGIGYVVTGIAATGSDALALAESTNPTLVLMDITILGPKALRARLGRHEAQASIVTEDPAFLQVIASLSQVGPSDLPVLVQGESGPAKSCSRGPSTIPAIVAWSRSWL